MIGRAFGQWLLSCHKLCGAVEAGDVAQRFLNKVAVVTGASGRLGRAVVQKFVSEGAKVVVFARDRGRLEEVAALAPARIVVVSGDVTRASDLDLLRETTLRRMGSVDVLVTAAERSRSAGLEDSTPELLAELFAVNFHGALQTIRTFAPHLNPPTSIVLVTITPADEQRPGCGAFAASKSALSSLTRTLAAELGVRGIRVNSVAPLRGDLPQGDAAQTVLFLASAEAAGITGQQILVAPPR
jgi:NAD(P)-dependent dehydrogenase (short-subunit alcohol dehydrogenase family)